MGSGPRMVACAHVRSRSTNGGGARRRRTGALRFLLALTLAAACGLFGAAGAAAQGSAGKVLLFHGGTTHPSVSAGVDAITALGAANNFEVETTTSAGAFTNANLAGYRAVVVLHSSGDVLNTDQRAALQAYVQAGGGFVGIGEAANLQPGDTFFSGLIGARPAASSSNTVTQQLVEVGDRVHPATRDLPLEWGPRSDAWYSWQQNPTGQVHTVARARFGATADDGFRTGTQSRPISWCRDFQGGRSFYTGMGRTTASYSEANFRDHLLGAIQWAAGMVRGGCKATIASNYQSVRLSNGTGALANSGESHGVSIASNGWAITIGRAACGSDAERGARIGQASFPRTLDFTNPNVGVGCAPIHIWDPEQHNGTVNSGITRAGTLTVYGDRGNGGETNGKIETGGLGLAVSPDFAQTGHVYIQYFPSFNAQNPIMAGLPDGAERRITKMGKGRISRFTIDLTTKQLKLDSEVKIFEYDSQIYSCCHRGGGMGFDSEGNLYVTTGDSNSSGGGYSGNYQNVRCPTGTPTQVSNDHCGANGISYRDARRTAGNTNDYNGKLLRLNPIEGIADGASPPVGVGTTYTLPTAASPNGPNLFNGTEGGGGKTKPEIYAMGLRNPSRLTIDPETDMPYSAWVGPDAGSPSVTQGPSTYEVASQIPRAGNWGWPYCMGNKQAYRDRTSASGDPLRTTNASGYVTGGPAGSPTQGWYDCDNIVNDSTNNTGLETFPHQTGTGADAGKVSPANIWYSRGNPGGDGCPVFPRENGASGAPNYAGTNTQLCPYYNGLGGHTVMSGPVYRYKADAASNAGRWPEYWDGRWFVHDFSGGNAKSFGFTFDKETAAAGGQPSYVDKMSPFISWSGGSYMDSKYGPDGALYVQTYDSYFEHGTNNGLHRITYTGGRDTPGPDPQWQAAGGDAIAFSIGKSGGISYSWNFGDGSPASTQRNPTHTYAQPGIYDVRLTVTYADGETASKTVEVNASDDAVAPTTTASLDPAQPGAGSTYKGDVKVTLSATDGAGDAAGVDLTEYRLNGGEWIQSQNAAKADPFVTTFTVKEKRSHQVEYRSRDAAGNIEAIKSIEFSIEGTTTPGGACLPQSDEFGGAALDPKWSVLRPAGGGPEVADGALRLPFLQGDFIANDPLASNTLLQNAPDGAWTATTKLASSAIDQNGEQAGLVVWKSENPNTFTKIVAIRSGSGGNQFEHIVTQNGSVNPPISQSITPAPGGQMPADVLLRARYDGTQVIGEFSADDGATWTRIGQAGHAGQLTGPLRIGVVAFRGSQGSGTAAFDWFRMHNGAEADGPIGCAAPGCNPLSDQFNGADLDDKWELLNPNPQKQPDVDGGHLTLPLVQGDLYGSNGSAQTLLQQAPSGSWVATAKIAHANINANGEAAGLALINSLNPNHFVKTAIQFKSDANPDQPGDQPGKWAERVLTADGAAVTLPGESVPWPNSGALNLTGAYAWVRFVHDAEAKTVTTWTSTNGTTFVQFGAALPVDQYLSRPGGLRVGVFGKHDGSGDDEVQVDAFNVVAGTTDPQTPGDDCGGSAGQCPQTDEFDGTALGSKWEVINPNPAALRVGGGELTLDTAQGDVRNSAFSAQNILLQDAPEGPWTATAKLDHRAIAVNGQAAGMVIYGQRDPNYFAKAAIQYKTNDLSGNPMNGIWAERVLTTNGATNASYGGSFPNTGKLAPPTNDLWLRVKYDGTNVSTEVSLDGTTFTATAPPFPASELGANGVTKIGLFVKHDAGNPTASVRFDSFVVDAESCGAAGDTTAPRTTHALDPAQPDGDGGWYVSPVEVTLSATDNEGGSGVDATEYRFAGDATWTDYDGPFTAEEDGEHELEYRSTDKDGNTESIRRVRFKVDASDPTTSAKINGEAPVSNYDDAVEVDLDAGDGNGSGVRVTEVRVDGGQWKPYVEEETILDSAQDLQAWKQAGGGGLNWVSQEGGFARTFGGLGMPWYPKEYGDFHLKLQWRDSGTGSTGNSGIFARFPHPEETAARPAAERYPCQVGSGQSDPAWVAIFCGHEIQINDHQASESQKTGSIYNFKPLDTTQAKVQDKGTWVDYELRVVGQTYTIIRNGEVLQEWQNSPDQSSSRAGDPSTSARQFARGYIGLQNHGNSDVVDFRNVRVLPLDEGSVRGPITVEGGGEHTVEYRSTDAAGNQEAVKKTTFTIGEADTTAPKTQHSLDPADPGSGPVKVTLTATDPDTGGPEPANHDVNAQPQSWAPNQVTATSGDKVTWHFPTSASLPHDVWVIEPGAGPNAQGTQVTDGTVEPGGEPVSYTFEDAGTWTFVCKLHGFRNQEGEWQGMVGTVDVAEGPPSNASGVASTQYRINTGGATGDWVESENAAGADPFTTTFTVDDEGEHVVEYRSTDVAGNVEATKSVAFAIGAANGAPTVTASAAPASGNAPLAVQFNSVASDPDGDELTTSWDFGNGARATGASPAYTYTQPGTYTARVTVTDPGGATGTDTVQVTVHGPTGSGDPPGTNPPGGDEAKNRPNVKTPKRAAARKVKRRGLKVRVTCTLDCRAGAVLRLSGKRIGKAKTTRVRADGTRTLVIRLDRKGRRKLQAALNRPGVKSKKASVVIKITAADGKRTIRRTVGLTG